MLCIPCQDHLSLHHAEAAEHRCNAAAKAYGGMLCIPCQDHLSLHHAEAAEYSCNAAGGICRNEAVAFHPSVCQYA